MASSRKPVPRADVERVAKALHTIGVDAGNQEASWGLLLPWQVTGYRAMARAVLRGEVLGIGPLVAAVAQRIGGAEAQVAERDAETIEALRLVLETGDENAELRAALVLAEAALADIGDATREPGDDLSWCERHAARDLPRIRSALGTEPTLLSYHEAQVAARDAEIARLRAEADRQRVTTADLDRIRVMLNDLRASALPPALVEAVRRLGEAKLATDAADDAWSKVLDTDDDDTPEADALRDTAEAALIAYEAADVECERQAAAWVAAERGSRG